MERIQFLWRYASRWKAQLALSLAAVTVVSATSLLYPWLVKQLVDEFSAASGNDHSTQWLALALVVLLVVSTLLGYYHQTRMNTLGIRLRNNIRSDLYRTLLAQPLTFHREQQVGQLSSIATEEIAKVQPLFTHFLVPLFQNAMFVVGCIGLMLYLNWLATLFVLLVMVLPLPYIIRSSKRIPRLASAAQESQGRAHALFEESLVAIREIKGFVRESLQLTRYTEMMQTGMTSEQEGSAIRVRIGQTVYFLLSSVLLVVFYAGASRTLFPSWSIGGLIAFYFYAYMMTMAVIAVERIHLTYQTIAGAIDRIMQYLPLPRDITADSDPPSFPTPSGRVEFNHVSFGYSDNARIFSEVSFAIDDGAWVLVTGASGSGKSTIMNLLLGFYEPQLGTILVGGQTMGIRTASYARRAIGFVGQDPLLIHGTLRENIAFRGTPLPDEQILKAVRIACLEDLLQDLPDGLDTIVGERGFTLSGGQKCRIAIARAIVDDPVILLLDEANAMLESDLEKQLWANLLETRQSRTTIILTHHPLNLPRVDMHLHVSDGHVHSMPLQATRPRDAQTA